MTEPRVPDTDLEATVDVMSRLGLRGADLFATLFEAIQDGAYVVDRRRSILLWNPAAERITGYPATEVVGRVCHDNLLQHVDQEGASLCLTRCPLDHCMVEATGRQGEVFLHHRDGHRVRVAVTTRPLFDALGNAVAGLETFIDTRDPKRDLGELQKLRHEVLTDGLTAIGNRRFGETVLGRLVQAGRSVYLPWGVLFLDIDDFKAFNDQWGHELGDRVLASVAKSVEGVLRSIDSLCRWGGEEFIAILPDIDRANLARVAARVEMVVRSTRVPGLPDEAPPVTLSIGGALHHPDEPWTDTLHRADQLMYESKRRGKARSTVEPALDA